MNRSSLQRARELLDAAWVRREDRIKRGDVGEWQTEVNECYRILEYLVEHLSPASVTHDETGLDDTWL